MLLPIVLLLMALVVLLWQSVTDQAMRVLKERLGLDYNRARSARTARGDRGVDRAHRGFFMAAPKKWFEPPPPHGGHLHGGQPWVRHGHNADRPSSVVNGKNWYVRP
jgi:hypothetical protein